LNHEPPLDPKSDRIMTNNPEIRELTRDVSASPYYSPDMAPIPASQRRWRAHDLAVLWISMSACVPTYMLASSLIGLGMNWWQSILTIFAGNCVVLIPMALNAHAGTRYGIPFPVYCRASFGMIGANVPAVMRALVACAWFGIQTWIGGGCFYTLIHAWDPNFDNGVKITGLGITARNLLVFSSSGSSTSPSFGAAFTRFACCSTSKRRC
jgi:NCS1 family nucleobase:cation symporter-1